MHCLTGALRGQSPCWKGERETQARARGKTPFPEKSACQNERTDFRRHATEMAGNVQARLTGDRTRSQTVVVGAQLPFTAYRQTLDPVGCCYDLEQEGLISD